MRAKLRGDLVELSGTRAMTAPRHIIESVAGKSLEVVNVTAYSVTLRLSRVVWRSEDAPGTYFGLGTTLLSVPHEWLWKDISKDEWTAYQKARGLPA